MALSASLQGQSKRRFIASPLLADAHAGIATVCACRLCL